MRTCSACVLALCLGSTTIAVAQVGVPYGSFQPNSGGPFDPANAPPAIDAGPAYAIPAYAKPDVVWFNAEYVLWWVRDEKSPALIQTFPDSLVNANPLPPGSVSTVFPQKDRINYPEFNGLRLTGGLWLNSDATIGLDGSAFKLEQNSRGYTAASLGSPVVARTYTSANSGTMDSLIFANPDPVNGYSGAVAANSTVSSLWGADANLRWNGYPIFADNTDYLFGVRYLDFREHLDIVGLAIFKEGSSLTVVDHFATTNQFYGGQIGINSRLCGYHGFSIEGSVKLAIGGIHQTATIEGYNTITSPTGVASTQSGGLYAQPSNIGTYSQNKFAVLPEVALNLSYNFTDNLAIYAGYNVLCLNNVVRPGTSINTSINDANVRYVANPTPGDSNEPIFKFHEQSFWVQGITVGLRLQF